MLRKMIINALDRKNYFANSKIEDVKEEIKVETEQEFENRMEAIADEKFREAIKSN